MVTMNGIGKYPWLSVIVILVLSAERIVIAEVVLDDDEPVPSSLYGPNDHITLLNSDNFNKKVYNKNRAFFVEFFSSWCGACIGYAETYKKLARELLQFRPIVQIAAVDCADDKNLKLCREHNIDGYPTIKYFKYMSKDPNDAVQYKGNKYNLNEVVLDIADLVHNDWMYQRPTEWPDFQTSDGSAKLDDILQKMSPSTSLLALIVEDNPSRTAWAEMIAFANDKRVHVEQIQSSDSVAQQFDIEETMEKPGLLLLRKGQPTPLYISRKRETWLEMQNKINEYLGQIPVMEAPKPHEDGLRDEKTPNDTDPPVTWSQFEVQMMDIITAVRYMLVAEIPRKSRISDEKLAALKSWVHTMKKYLPGTIPIRKLLYRLNHWLENLAGELTSKQWIHQVKTIQEQLGQPLPSTATYMACRGSKAHYRGYPCGMWTIIHAMSVQAYKIEKDNPNFNANSDLIEPFHQFIWNFFGCIECATHFHEGILKQNMTTVVTPEDGVMWLWRTHNIVSKYIASKASEDPFFPKQQFPPASLCSECWKQDEHFDEKAVLDFLVNYYSNFKTDGLKSMPGYKVTDFKDGKKIGVEIKRLNPKFEIGAFNVDAVEEVDQRLANNFGNLAEGGFADNGVNGVRYYGGSSANRSFSVLWLSIIAMMVLFIYIKYRRNRFKLWKTFCYNDYNL